MSLNNQDLEETALKATVLATTNTFKGAFKATMGFYAAQFVATILGLGTLALGIGLIYLILKFVF